MILIKPKSAVNLREKLDWIIGKEQRNVMHVIGDQNMYQDFMNLHKKASVTTNSAINYGTHVLCVYPLGPNIPIGNPVTNTHMFGHIVQQSQGESGNVPFQIKPPEAAVTDIPGLLILKTYH